jgi:hypothetical protein
MLPIIFRTNYIIFSNILQNLNQLLQIFLHLSTLLNPLWIPSILALHSFILDISLVVMACLSRVRFPIKSLDFSIDLILPAAL